MAEKMIRLAVLIDGDNTTWSANAEIIDVPALEYDDFAASSKGARAYLPGKDAKKAVACIEAIVEILYPDGNLDAHWAVDTIEEVAEAIKASGFSPEEEEDR